MWVGVGTHLWFQFDVCEQHRLDLDDDVTGQVSILKKIMSQKYESWDNLELTNTFLSPLLFILFINNF